MNRLLILRIDGIANVLLGLAMLLFPRTLLKVVVGPVDCAPLLSIFGSVIAGIGLALLVQTKRLDGAYYGLGLTGAMLINICFGLALGAWLLLGNLEPSPVGAILLWVLTAILLVFGVFELSVILRHLHTSTEG